MVNLDCIFRWSDFKAPLQTFFFFFSKTSQGLDQQDRWHLSSQIHTTTGTLAHKSHTMFSHGPVQGTRVDMDIFYLLATGDISSDL